MEKVLSIPFSLRFPLKLWREFTATAKREGRGKSEIIRQLVREYIDAAHCNDHPQSHRSANV